jgi:(E)-4-hydroxy-3-methylbut-2-enyl-diphosphate synthase
MVVAMRMKRRHCREIKIGNVKIGGNNPIAVQSMAKTFTSDLSATVKQIKELQNVGCQIVRVAVRDNTDAANLKKIKQRIAIPLVADIHFNKNLAIKAIESGVDKIRLNPGNIYKKNEIKEIAVAAKLARIPIRVGVNSGSITQCSMHEARYSKEPSRLMAKCALDYIQLLESIGFHDIVVSIKGSDISNTIRANEIIAKSCAYPLHLGVTATGSSFTGIVKSAIAIGRLLSEGIGDTIRISLTDRAVQEVRAAFYILEALGLRSSKPEIISCPTCGRCEIDLIKIVRQLENKLATRYSLLATRPIKVAIMGCVVNGPGEARTADLGVAFGKREGLLFRKGKPIRKIPFQKCVDTLLNELEVMGY